MRPIVENDRTTLKERENGMDDTEGGRVPPVNCQMENRESVGNIIYFMSYYLSLFTLSPRWTSFVIDLHLDCGVRQCEVR